MSKNVNKTIKTVVHDHPRFKSYTTGKVQEIKLLLKKKKKKEIINPLLRYSLT